MPYKYIGATCRISISGCVSVTLIGVRLRLRLRGSLNVDLCVSVTIGVSVRVSVLLRVIGYRLWVIGYGLLVIGYPIVSFRHFVLIIIVIATSHPTPETSIPGGGNCEHGQIRRDCKECKGDLCKGHVSVWIGFVFLLLLCYFCCFR